MKKIKPILQDDDCECGLACLAMVLCLFGYPTDLPHMRRRSVGFERGMSFRSLIDTAAHFKLDARPVRLGAQEARTLKKGTILHWAGDHFVVFISYRFGHYRIIDPAVGARRITDQEFCSSFTGFAMEMSPNAEFSIRRYKSPSVLPKLLSVIPNIFTSFSKLLVLSFGLELIVLLYPMLTQVVVDEVIRTNDTSLMFSVVVVVSALAIIQFGISLTRDEMSVRFKQRSANRLKITVLRHLVELPVEWFGKRQVGDIVNRFSGISTIQNAFTTTSMQNILDGIMAIITGIMVIIYGGWIGVIACISVLVDVIMKLTMYAKYRSITVSGARLDAQQQTHFLESIRNIASVKMTGMLNKRTGIWANKNYDLSNVRTIQQRIEFVCSAIQELAAGIDRSIVLYLGGSAVLSHHMTVGSLIAFLSYKEQTDRRIASLTSALFSLRSLSVQTERLRDIVATAPEGAQISDRMSGKQFSSINSNSIFVSGISKKYSNTSEAIFDNVDATIFPGSRVIFKGVSGCGKSTLLKTIIGLIDPTGGSLEINNCTRSPESLHKYRSYFSGVLQDDSLFSGSILENISCFDPRPDISRVEAAAHSARILDDIRKMTMGLQTFVSASASTLSGGQRQRILLARAIYLDAPILFLDEATSNLDHASEEAIMRYFCDIKKTLLYVTHRRSLDQYATHSFSFLNGKVLFTKI
ncbi:peptidase domain-containing ABC transporter [Neokomagataea anthophila]|uniref:Peptidase domain-containing ABC transporter n=1 Tax=Neokomagataea anthophila TaxID=2826925 RepID=A0ABS5E9B0_9PROT|nr:peptidase domain-containing ABC transporter [Neokomagataea anthophila]MBR0560500.1 peptidase domain-containing ABC transporter [Neokomagataea anthophila]